MLKPNKHMEAIRCVRRSLLLVAAIMFLALPVAHAAAADWSWPLPTSRYQELAIQQRAVVDRASELNRRGEGARRDRQDAEAVTSFRAASQEWKRFLREFMDAPERIVAYAHFMQAYSLHQAGDRHTAIKLYAEVAEFYPDAPDMLVAAFYWSGVARDENGDPAQAVADWEAASDVPGTDGHPLAVKALGSLAEGIWGRGNWEAGASKWVAMLEDHPRAPRATRELAAKRLMLWRGLQGRWGEVTQLAETIGEESDNPTGWINNFTWGSWHYTIPGWLTDTYFRRLNEGKTSAAAIQKFRGELMDWYVGRHDYFEEAGKGWEHSLSSFEYLRRLRPSEAKAAAGKLVDQLRRSEMSVAERETHARRLIEMLIQSRLPDEARQLLGMIADPIGRLWLAYSVEERVGSYVEAESILNQLDLESSPKVVREAKRKRAHLYKNRMNLFEKAITCFNEAVDPPESLWGIQECLWRLGKKTEAHAVLGEIIGVFPQDAARAMFQKAEYFRLDGNVTSAVAYYRRILSNPEWGKSGEASRAHQVLENLDLETGGGVLNSVN